MSHDVFKQCFYASRFPVARVTAASHVPLTSTVHKKHVVHYQQVFSPPLSFWCLGNTLVMQETFLLRHAARRRSSSSSSSSCKDIGCLLSFPRRGATFRQLPFKKKTQNDSSCSARALFCLGQGLGFGFVILSCALHSSTDADRCLSRERRRSQTYFLSLQRRYPRLFFF